ncbi:MAG: hypothetical protein WB987_03455 [Candidatus Acidiferrales bacterium]
MIDLRQGWRRITTTRYTLALEAEVSRLRAENRALLNSILGIAGVPPLPVSVAGLPSAQEQLDEAASGPTTNLGSAGMRKAALGGAGKPLPSRHFRIGSSSMTSDLKSSAAVPMRRRSWQQINRMLEFESARKDKHIADATETRK